MWYEKIKTVFKKVDKGFKISQELKEKSVFSQFSHLTKFVPLDPSYPGHTL